MELGIGVDMVEVNRFSDIKPGEKNEFLLERAWTKKEIEYCLKKQFPERHLAARFAAREATIKAMSEIGEKKVDYSDISIKRDTFGSPRIEINKKSEYDIKISWSHNSQYAIAFVIVTKKENGTNKNAN